tara:strand:+ start:4565 stop:5452 length:888 start_codon:yes stop_codon:yes gene_type:complete
MKIVNVKKHKCTHFCGRPESFDPDNENHGIDASILGNPFKVKPWGSYTREESVSAHRLWLNEQRLKDTYIWGELMVIPMDSTLGCFCYPLSCHCDNLRDAYHWADTIGERDRVIEERLKQKAKMVTVAIDRSESKKTHDGNISTLKDNQVFVFGANKQGFHGAGSAGYASFNKWGNHWREEKYNENPYGWKGLWNEKGKTGAMVGTEGKSYGLVTVHKAGDKRSLTEDQMIENISDLYQVAAKRPALEFLVAQSDKTGLNGFSGKEMAKFFASAGNIPANVIFQKELLTLIQNHI